MMTHLRTLCTPEPPLPRTSRERTRQHSSRTPCQPCSAHLGSFCKQPPPAKTCPSGILCKRLILWPPCPCLQSMRGSCPHFRPPGRSPARSPCTQQRQRRSRTPPGTPASIPSCGPRRLSTSPRGSSRTRGRSRLCRRTGRRCCPA